MRSKRYRRARRAAVICTALVVLSVAHITRAHSEERKDALPVFLGVGVAYGRSDLIDFDTRPSEEWEGGALWGGGLVFEKMFSRHFGLHSGMWYSKFHYTLTMHESKGPNEFIIEHIALTMPVYGMASLSAGPFTFSLLAGLCFTYITESYIHADFPEQRRTTNAMRYSNYAQEGFGGGLEIKFSLSSSFDVFVAGTVERYLSDYLINTHGMNGKIVLYSVKLGVLHRAF